MHASQTGGPDDPTADTATAEEGPAARSAGYSAGYEGQSLPCAFPGGCPNPVAYTGTGRRPKYCGQLVGGVVHVRSNAHRAIKGQLAVVHAPQVPPSPDEDTTGEAGARPISTARATLETLHRDLVTTATAHRAALGGLVERIEAAVGAVTDADAVATEVASVHRDARRRIDDAEAAADAAHARARAADAAAASATSARDTALAAAEQARLDSDTARDLAREALEARDAAVAETGRLTGELADLTVARDAVAEELTAVGAERDEVQRRLAAAEGELERVKADLATATDAITTLTDTRDRLRTEVAAQRDALVAERHRSELADQQRRHAEEVAQAARQELARQAQREEVERERLVAERDAARSDARDARQDQQRDARELRAAREEVAELRMRSEAAAKSLADHVAHAEQRLTDQRLAHEAHIRSLLAGPAAQPDQPGDGT